MDLEDAGTWVKFVIHDRDASFTLAFDDVFMAAGARVIRSGPGTPDEFDHGMLGRHRPHRSLKQAAPMRALPEAVTDLDHFPVQRRGRAGGVIHEYSLVA